jgi:hypothetical protein
MPDALQDVSTHSVLDSGLRPQDAHVVDRLGDPTGFTEQHRVNEHQWIFPRSRRDDVVASVRPWRNIETCLPASIATDPRHD